MAFIIVIAKLSERTRTRNAQPGTSQPEAAPAGAMVHKNEAERGH